MRSTCGKPAIAACFTALTVSAAGCAATSAPPNPFSDNRTAAEVEFRAGTPDEIVHSEIVQRGATDQTAMQLIRRLRPAWLRPRGQTSFNDGAAAYPVVYIDEIRHGGLSTLNHIPSTEVLRMKFFSTADATTRWGTGHPSGAINIVTGR